MGNISPPANQKYPSNLSRYIIVKFPNSWDKGYCKFAETKPGYLERTGNQKGTGFSKANSELEDDGASLQNSEGKSRNTEASYQMSVTAG